MQFTIKSRKLDQDFRFFMPYGGGYVYLENGANHGTLGRQICEGGDFRGNAVSSTPENFENDCRRWYRQRVRSLA